MQTELGNRIIAEATIRLPIIGDLSKKIAVSRFSRTFCSLLNAGVPILNALKITGSVMGNRLFEEAISDMAIKVQGGNRIASTIKGNPLFPTMMQKMMEIGENSGKLDVMLEKVADFYDQEVGEALDGLTAALTPILTVVMGIMIGGIALSVFMPLFSIVQQMK
jgi:type IV pilus assembly protein PilC